MTDPNSLTSPTKSSPPARRLAWVMFGLVAIVAIICATIIYTISTMRGIGEDAASSTREIGEAIWGKMEDAGKALTALGNDFLGGKVTVSVNTYMQGITGSNRLQFATVDDVIVCHYEEKRATSEVELLCRAQAQYVYYLDLEKEWQFIMPDETTLEVYVPDIEFNKPSIDFAKREEWILKSSIMRDEQEVMRDLQKQLTIEARRSALRNIASVRAEGRTQVERFVRQWVVSTYGNDEMLTIKVYFPGEGSPPKPATTESPEPSSLKP